LTAERPGYDLAAWRRRIPLLASCIPMNNCSQAPQTEATRAAAERYLESWNRSGMDWDAWMAEVALAWLLSRPVVTAPIIGATKLPHLETAFRSLDLSLTEDEIATLEAPYRPHAVRGWH
jgi:aryl-alcohol dehydrogenase-like predicted oxidoreductase